MRFARRVGVAAADLEVYQRITGPAGVFAEDLIAASDEQISRTLEVLEAQRARTLALMGTASEVELDEADPSVNQPDWMSWRTPRAILRHIADTESRTYPRWCGLPELQRVPDLRDELDRSADHIRNVLTTMPRVFQTEHRGEVWTPVEASTSPRLARTHRADLPPSTSGSAVMESAPGVLTEACPPAD